ncbi:MAG: sugar phosphate nucleotidyltransferase [bacterium]|nr:sugar phosphate nucleotidyltransferase [bacterium]
MKCVIAAAGKGTRMLELTKDRPKHVIEVLNKPFLFYLLENLKKGGVDELILVVGYQKQAMEKFAEDYKNDFKITLVDQFEKFGKKYGTSVPIEAAKEYVEDETFLAVYGDNLYSPNDVKRLIETEDTNYMCVLEHDHPENYGVTVADSGGYLTRIVEKPKEYISNCINTGLYKFTPEIFEEVARVGLSSRGEYELTDAIQALAEKHKVKVLKLQDYWLDFGKPEDIATVEKFLKKQGRE